MTREEIAVKYAMDVAVSMLDLKKHKNGAGSQARRKEARKAEIAEAHKLLQKLKIKVNPDNTFQPEGSYWTYKVSPGSMFEFKNKYKKEIEEALKTGKPFKAKI